jgi:hypothetical protein
MFQGREDGVQRREAARIEEGGEKKGSERQC